jgi:hypothetical protein
MHHGASSDKLVIDRTALTSEAMAALRWSIPMNGDSA